MDDLDMPTIGPPGPPKCDRYYTENNKTHFIYGGYEGIPENLIINVSAWAVLLILFSLLRKIAGDYGRLALVSRTEARNLLPDDSGYNVETKDDSDDLDDNDSLEYEVRRRRMWTSLFYGDHTNASDMRSSQESLDTQVHRQDKGICSWIVAYLRIRDENILAKSGRDAVQYLMFQRYLLVYMSVVCLLSIGVILPVNFQGDLEGNTQAFGHTTISNVNTNSPTIWVHSSFAVLYLVIAVFFMRHFSGKLQDQFEEDEQATKTLMISNIPRDKCSRNLLLQHFQEAYPEYPPEDIQFAYNISKLAKLDKKRTWAKDGLVNSDAIFRKSGSRPTLRPIPCGQICCCNSNGCRPVDAIEHYKNEEAKFAHLCEQEKVVAFQHTLGLAFVTFEDDTVAARVHKDFRVSCKGAHNPHPSSVSRELGVHNWEVRYAPAPDNIYWENLSVSDASWWCKAICINFFLSILLFFMTTPSLFLNIVSNQDEYKKAIENLHNPLLAQFLPTLILWAFSALLPIIVYYSDQFIGHWTRSSEHHAVMRKTYMFLVLMVLILPSLGLTSAWALLEWLATKNEQKYQFRWQCIFIPDNGAFFVNYVITSAFIGTAMELIRFPELFMYGLKLLLARSAAERTSVRKAVLWEFQFGVQYAWMLCVFAVVMAFSIPCPLITPFGLIYLLFKHAVDRYNIYFAYGPSKIDKNLHTSAINFVIVGVILLQCAVVFFTLLRTEKVRTITIFLLVALFITLLIFSGRLCFGWFKGFSPISYRKHTDDEEQVTPPVQESKPFIPRVLLPKEDQGMDNGTSSNMGQYGATDPQTPGSMADSEHVIIQGGNEYAT